jgi:DNA primase
LRTCHRDASQPRYRFPSGFPKSEFVFNLHRALAAGEPSVVVVEGFFDCFKLHQAGVHSVVALMGSALYPQQPCALLQHFRRVILMLDGDAAGRHATAECAARLGAHCEVEIINLPDGMQPDLMSNDRIRQALKAWPSTGQMR